MFCSKCGGQISEEAAFCIKCGNPVAAAETEAPANARETIVYEGKVRRTPGSDGKMMLTTRQLSWKRSASSFAAIGVLALAINDLSIPLEQILRVKVYSSDGKGIQITLNTGKEYKFVFRNTEDANCVFNHLSATV